MQNMGCRFISGGSAKVIIKAGVTKGVEPDLVDFDKSSLLHLLESKGSSCEKTKNYVIRKAVNLAFQIVGIAAEDCYNLLQHGVHEFLILLTAFTGG